MTDLDTIATELVQQATWSRATGEDPIWPDTDELDLQALTDLLVRLLGGAEVHTLAADRVKTVIGLRLGEGAVYRDEQNFYRVARPYQWKPQDPDALWAWLGDDAKMAFNSDYVKVSAVRALAEARGEPPQRVVGTLLYKDVRKDPTLQIQPLGNRYVPKYAANMPPYEPRKT